MGNRGRIVMLVAVVAAFGLPRSGPRSWGSDPERRMRVSAKVQITNFLGALGQVKLDTGKYPATEQGLSPLREKPENMLGWNGPYIQQEVPLDPWGHPYLYRFPGEHGDEPDLISLGADGKPGGDGENADIVSWKSN